MAEEAVRAEGWGGVLGGPWGGWGGSGGGPLHVRWCPQVLERLLLGLRPPESREPRGGSLLVALAAEGDGGDTGRPRCTITVAAGGELSRGVEAEDLRGAARGVLELPRVPSTPAPCCGRILRRARLCLAFQLSPPPGTLSPACVALRRFLHKTSVVHPEVPSPGGGTHTRTGVHPWVGVCGGGPHIDPRLPPGGISLLRQRERHRGLAHLRTGERLGAGGSAAAGPEPALCTDPSWLADWERFGFTAAPHDQPEGEEELVTPDAAYAVRHGTGVPGGDRHPQTLLLFLFLRHEDPFQVYDTAARRLLLAHLDQTLLSSRPALATGLRTLVHPVLEELCRRHEGQQRLARSLPVVLDAVTAVVTGSTSARFRRACLRAMQVEDTPALAAAVRRSLAEVTHRRLLPCASCETPGDTRRGEGRAGGGGQGGNPPPPRPLTPLSPPHQGPQRVPVCGGDGGRRKRRRRRCVPRAARGRWAVTGRGPQGWAPPLNPPIDPPRPAGMAAGGGRPGGVDGLRNGDGAPPHIPVLTQFTQFTWSQLVLAAPQDWYPQSFPVPPVSASSPSRSQFPQSFPVLPVGPSSPSQSQFPQSLLVLPVVPSSPSRSQFPQSFPVLPVGPSSPNRSQFPQSLLVLPVVPSSPTGPSSPSRSQFPQSFPVLPVSPSYPNHSQFPQPIPVPPSQFPTRFPSPRPAPLPAPPRPATPPPAP
ncbi:type 2 DNA topoisomerase 6 subunit B-like [Morphnus guianensis]